MRIMLACCAGMSTSLVVSKMQDEAAKQGKDYKIWAVEQGQIEDELGNFDVLLLGPQVRYELKNVKKMFLDKPAEIINMQDYGTMNGAKVLDTALKLGGK